MRTLLRWLWLAVLALLLATPCFADWTFSVTNAPTAVTVPTGQSGYYSIVVRENSATPSAAFTVFKTPNVQSGQTGTVMPVGSAYVFQALSFPYTAGQTIGWVQSSAAGPYTFVAVTSGANLPIVTSQNIQGLLPFSILSPPTNCGTLGGIPDWNGTSWTCTIAGNPVVTVSGLSSLLASVYVAIVTDGQGPNDCTVGGGSTIVTCQKNGSGTWASIATNTATYFKACTVSLGDGLNSIAAGTYSVSFQCKNDSSAPIALTALACASDNNGSSTCNAALSTGSGLLTGAITATNSWAAGTQSSTTSVASGQWINATLVADGVSKIIALDVVGHL